MLLICALTDWGFSLINQNGIFSNYWKIAKVISILKKSKNKLSKQLPAVLDFDLYFESNQKKKNRRHKSSKLDQPPDARKK